MTVVTSRLRSRTALGTAAAVLLSACAAGAVVSPDVSTKPDIAPELRFYNWDDYIDLETVTAFEAEYGIAVTIATFVDETEMAAVIAGDTGRYDVVISSDYLLAEMAAQKLLAELDHANIPNLANIDPRYVDLPSDPGNRYSAPYDWGTTGIVYNTTCFEPEVASWAVLSDARLVGRVSMDSDPRVNIGAALKYLGHPIGSTDPDDLAEAVAFLIELKSQQGVQFLEWDDLYDGMLSGDLCAGVAYNGDAAWLMDESDDLDFFIPEEGADYYLDSFVIPRDAPNKAGAELFINFLLRPEVHAANTNYTGYGNPNRASLEAGLIDAETLEDPVVYLAVDNLEAWPVFDRATRALWNAAWAEVERADALAIAP